MKLNKIIAIIFAVCLLLSGCSNGHSLSDLTIVQAVGIDTNNGDTAVSIQYLNLDKSGSTTDSLTSGITSVVEGKSNSVSGAISFTSAELSKELFFGQNKIIIFGEEYIKSGVDRDFDYLLRSVDSRPDVLIAVASDKAKTVLESKERDARVPAESLYDLIKTGEQNGVSVFVSVNDVLNVYADKTSDMFLPVLKAQKDACVCDGIAIFSNEKFKRVLNKNQTLGFLFLSNKIEGGFLNINDNELGKIDLEISKSTTKLKMKKGKNGYYLDCNVKVKLMLDEVENGITSVIDKDRIDSIEKLVDKRVSQLCEYAFNTCIEEKSDSLMLGRIMAKCLPKDYDRLKDDWLDNIDKIEIRVHSNSIIEKVNDTALRG